VNANPESRLEGWLRSAVEDAERRGLPDLKPLLETLARATAGLRAADIEAGRAETETHEAGERRHD
jgi:hypothetical protein